MKTEYKVDATGHNNLSGLLCPFSKNEGIITAAEGGGKEVINVYKK